jgi:hypothetical protein
MVVAADDRAVEIGTCTRTATNSMAAFVSCEDRKDLDVDRLLALECKAHPKADELCEAIMCSPMRAAFLILHHCLSRHFALLIMILKGFQTVWPARIVLSGNRGSPLGALSYHSYVRYMQVVVLKD